MQPTTNQSVPATSSVPSNAADRQSPTTPQKPVPLSDELLRLIGGGTSSSPNGGW